MKVYIICIYFSIFVKKELKKRRTENEGVGVINGGRRTEGRRRGREERGEGGEEKEEEHEEGEEEEDKDGRGEGEEE